MQKACVTNVDMSLINWVQMIVRKAKDWKPKIGQPNDNVLAFAAVGAHLAH